MEDHVEVKHNPNDTEVQQTCHESDSTDLMETSFCGEEHSMANGYQEVTYIKTEEPDCDLEQVVVKEEFCDLRHELQVCGLV
ncbi:hypothetical protein FHG87_021169 [Trinorchestia longiramus]|nr:hypothetical protein FHG87_021169 [Trinorchestia longiramus]